MEKKIITMLEELLEREEGKIKLEDEFRNYDGWDSLAYLSVIAEIDDELDIVIPRDDFQNLKTVNDLIKYIESKRG